MSNPEEMLVQLINSINKLSTLVQNVNDSIAKLSTQIAQLEGKMSGFSNVETQVSEVGLKLGEIPGMKQMISNLNAKIDGLGTAVSTPAPVAQAPVAESKPSKKKKDEEYVSPGVVEEEPAITSGSEADAAFTAVSSKFKHITQMISPLDEDQRKEERTFEKNRLNFTKTLNIYLTFSGI